MKHVSEALGNIINNFSTVNSINKSKEYKNTVNSISISNDSLIKKICDLIKAEEIQPEGIALLLAELLDDKKSLPYYILLAKEHNPGELLSAAYQTKEKAQLGLLHRSKPVYFIGILRKRGFKVKFK